MKKNKKTKKKKKGKIQMTPFSVYLKKTFITTLLVIIFILGFFIARDLVENKDKNNFKYDAIDNNKRLVRKDLINGII